jgi:SNF2 family DNA or RNA helicase
MFLRNQLHDYQENIAIPFMRNNPNSGLFLGMGLGKTIICLTVLVDLYNDGLLKGHVLIVAPKRVALSTWPDEIANWEHLSGLTYELINGNRIERTVKLKSTALIHIISYDNVAWMCKALNRRWPYRTIILDESSFIKSYKAKRFLALRSVVDFNKRSLVDRVHILSASPAVENYEHFWPQLYMLDNGKSLGHNITKFRHLYMSSNNYTYGWKIRNKECANAVLDKVALKCLIMKSEDYVDVTEPVLRDIYFELSKEERKHYTEFANKHVYNIDEVSITTSSKAALMLKLQQIASGSIYEMLKTDTGEKVLVKSIIHKIHNEKIEYVKELIESLDGGSIIIAYHWKSSKQDLERVFPKAISFNDERYSSEQVVKMWNKRKIPILLLHPQSASHGLNLQGGGNTLLFYDMPWSWERYNQTIGRLARQGQTEVVNVFHLIARNTIDEDVRKALRNKTDGNVYILDKIKEYRDLFS